MDALALQSLESKRLYKNTGLIHCSGVLGLLERKLANCLFYYAKSRIEKERIHVIDMKTILSILNINTRNTKKLKDSIKNLLTTVLEWNILDPMTSDASWRACTILASASFDKATLTYEYSDMLREHINNPAMYGNICLLTQSKFKSSYSLTIYENCCRYRKLGATKWFDIEQLKRILGPGSESYKKFSYFKSRILNKAVDEINAYADFLIEIDLDKKRGWPSKIRFIITDKSLPKLKVINSIEEELKEYKFSVIQLKKTKASYSEEYIKEKIDYVNNYTGKVKNKKSLLLSALKYDYKSNGLIEPEVPKISFSTEQVKQYEAYRKKMILSWFSGLTNADQKRCLKCCIKYIEKTKSSWSVLIIIAKKAVKDNDFEGLEFKSSIDDIIIEYYKENITKKSNKYEASFPSLLNIREYSNQTIELVTI